MVVVVGWFYFLLHITITISNYLTSDVGGIRNPRLSKWLLVVVKLNDNNFL
jgi:hypothetical protein